VLRDGLFEIPLRPGSHKPELPSDTSGTLVAPTTEDDSDLNPCIRHCLPSKEGEAHRQIDRVLLSQVLEETGGNQHQAARRLGIARETLRRRLRELGLHVNRWLEVRDEEKA
jgi:transcriptional regulator with GAF, ATPase, and Fis domain